MDGLISCHVVSCSKRATNWFVAKLYPSTKEVKGIKINLDFIFNNFPVHRTCLRLVIIIFNVAFSFLSHKHPYGNLLVYFTLFIL